MSRKNAEFLSLNGSNKSDKKEIEMSGAEENEDEENNEGEEGQEVENCEEGDEKGGVSKSMEKKYWYRGEIMALVDVNKNK